MNTSLNKSINILVVDDEQAEAQLVSEVLKQFGYNVTMATDGFKAIAACKVRAPDLILLDLQMPFMSGMDVYNRLRGEEKTRYIPVIFLAQKESQREWEGNEDLGDQELLVKPLEASELMSRVRTVLKMKALTDEIRKKEGQIKELSMIDTLTALRNSHYLNDFLKMEIKRSKRYGIPLSVVMLEIDQQKELLRQWGQKAVDQILVQLASLLSHGNRQSDVLARTNPFEFTIVLPHTPADGAIEVAERLRNIVAQGAFVVGDEHVSFTLSLGLCQWAEGMDDEGRILISHARAALTHARASGGNMTLMAQ